MLRGARLTRHGCLRAGLALCALAAASVATACGSGGGGSGTPTLNWYAFNEPGGAYDQAVADCNKEAKGKYKIVYQKLPTDANQQRELVVRRLAAKDDSIDIIGMDVIWTAELARAGWILPWKGQRETVAKEGKLQGPLKTVEYKGTVYGLPFTSNTQLLWYRKDEVPNPGNEVTWDQLIKTAEEKGKSIEVQAAQYEGLTVWVNALIAGAGGQIVDQAGNVKVDSTAKDAAEIMSKLANSSAAPPGMSINKEDEARIGFETGRSIYEINYPFVYPSAAAVGKDFQKNMGWARYPRTVPDKPSRPPLGGINLGISAYSNHPDQAFDAAECLASDQHQVVAAVKGGLPPTTESVYDNPQVKKAYPFSTLLRKSIDDAAPRPVTPAYNDISLAIQKTFHPPDGIDPNSIESQLRDRLDKAAEGKIF
jgi:trehalose/maltose transport system substrate-binding protein